MSQVSSTQGYKPVSSVPLSQITSIFSNQIDNIQMQRSNSFSGKRSFINTAYSSNTMDYAQMRSSKIQNLPNFKKLNLGENMPFVVVFQSIEIERLSTEIESNRIKIKDFERQIFNAQNYQVQIRELTEKCFALEMERVKLVEEIEKLNLISQQLYTELEEMKRKYAEVDLTLRDKFEMERNRNNELMQDIERWKARYMAAERSKDKELEDLRQMLESQRKSMIDREIRELTLRFQTDRGNLENQIRKLREGIEYKNRELEEFRQRCQKYEVSMMELRKSQTTIADLNGKIGIINQEVSRLNDLLRQKQEEIEGGRQKEYKLQQQLKEQQQWEFENKQLRGNLENRTREIEDWRIKCGRLEDEVAKGREIAHINQELTKRLELAGRKIDEMGENLRGKIEEVEQWKQRLARQETETNKYKNLEVELRNNEAKIGNLTGEIERLNNVIRSRLSDVQEWKGKCGKLEVTVNNFGVMQRNFRELQDKMQDQVRNSQQFKNRINRYQIQINNLRNVERRLEDTDRKNSVLNNEVDRLNNMLRSKTQEVEDSRTKNNKMESTLSQYRNIEVKMQEHEGTIAMLTQEIERLNNMLRNKNEEYERLANRCRGLEDQVNFLKAHETKLADNERVIQNLNVTINEFKRNVQNEQDRYRGLEGKLRDFEGNLYNLNQERDKVNGQLKQKTFEFEDLRNKFSRLEQEMYHLKEIQNEHKEGKNKIRGLLGEQERYERTLKEMNDQLQQERRVSNDFGCKIIILSAEIERNSGNTGIKSKEFLEMKESFYRLEKNCRDKDNEILVLSQKVISIEKQLIFITSELEKYLGLVTAHERKAQELEQEIAQYQDYARRIMILSAEIDRITGENRGLQEDIRKLRLRYADNIAQEKKHEDICLNFVMLFIEIESLRSRLAEREVSIEQMRKSVLDPVRNMK